MATIQHQRTTVAGVFKIGISQNAKCDILVGFQNLVTYICIRIYISCKNTFGVRKGAAVK